MNTPQPMARRIGRPDWRLRGLDIVGAATRAVLVLFVGAFFAAAWFARPSADDFCFGATTLEHGIAGAVAYWYKAQSAFYTTAWLMSLASADGRLSAAYPYVLWAVYCASIVAIWLLLRAALGHVLSRAECFWASLGAHALWFSMLPSIREGLYWMNAAVGYTLGVGLLAAMLAAAIGARMAQEGWRRNLFWVLAAALTVLGAGLNPFVALTGLVVLLVGCMAEWQDRRARVLWSSLFAMGVACLLLILAAPGTAARSRRIDHAPDLVAAIAGTVLSGANYITYWAGHLAPWAAAFIAIPFVARAGNSSQACMALQGWRSNALLIAALGTAFIAFFVTYWSLGTSPTSRHLNVAFQGFLFAWFAVLALLVLRVARSQPRTLAVSPILTAGAHAALILSLLNSPNLRSVVRAVQEGPAYAAQHADRLLRVANASKQGSSHTITLPPLAVKPAALFFTDITEDVNDWRNACMAYYLGVPELAMEPSPAGLTAPSPGER